MKIFLVPCNYMFGGATVIALSVDGELLGSEFGEVFGNGFCSGAISLRDDESYLDIYKEKYGENYETVYVGADFEYKEELDIAIKKCKHLTAK